MVSSGTNAYFISGFYCIRMNDSISVTIGTMNQFNVLSNYIAEIKRNVMPMCLSITQVLPEIALNIRTVLVS